MTRVAMAPFQLELCGVDERGARFEGVIDRPGELMSGFVVIGGVPTPNALRLEVQRAGQEVITVSGEPLSLSSDAIAFVGPAVLFAVRDRVVLYAHPLATLAVLKVLVERKDDGVRYG